jgi:hypothetical protein
MEAHLKRLLLDLRERLSEALADSPEVSETLDELRKNGYAVQLLMDCKREVLQEREAPKRPAAEAGTFRMNAPDLAFLRSVGIDPTRTTRGLRQGRLRAPRSEARPAVSRERVTDAQISEAQGGARLPGRRTSG